MLLEEFSTIFDRPEKVKKLREYILSLAVRGKLVEQDENDEPASVLLDRIREEKDRLIKEKMIKKEKPLPEISEDEIPYELPKGWEWVRLGNLGITQTGTTPSTKNPEYFGGNIPFIKPADINDKGVNYFNETLTEEGLSAGREVLENSLLMVCIGTIGKSYFVDRRCSCNQQINAITFLDKIDAKTIYYFTNSPDFYNEIMKKATGTTMLIVNKSKWENIIMPLPPLNEQRRIVEKLDYLMEFCDKLESQLERKVKYGSLSAKSVLNGVSNCSSYDELEKALKFIIENFKDLTLADGAVGELKNAILSLAVKGKLVPQDESDEPANILLERIREEKDRLVKEKKIKKEKPLPEISEDEIPYELPKGWEWVRLGNIGEIIGGGTPKTSHPEYFSEDEIVWLTPADLNGLKEKYISKGRRYISNLGLEKSSAQLLPKGSILFSSRAPIGYVAIAEVDLSTNQGFKSCVPYIMDINEYIYYTLKFKGKEIDENASGTTFKEVSGKIVSQVIIPLPPLNEQKRIVEKVDRLMKVCDELELKIEESKKYNEKLMESILKESFKA